MWRGVLQSTSQRALGPRATRSNGVSGTTPGKGLATEHIWSRSVTPNLLLTGTIGSSFLPYRDFTGSGALT